MSETVAVARANVWELVGDTDPSNRALDRVQYAHLIVSKAQELASEIGLGTTWVASAFTLSAGSLADYTLPSGIQYTQIQGMRIAATGQELTPVGFNVMQALRQGLIAGSGRGDPLFFHHWEGPDQVVNVRVETIPSASRAIDVKRAILPLTTFTDATDLPFADPLLRAIEKAVAVEVASGMDPDKLQARNITEKRMLLWQADVERAIKNEKRRHAVLHQAPVFLGRLTV